MHTGQSEMLTLWKRFGHDMNPTLLLLSCTHTAMYLKISSGKKNHIFARKWMFVEAVANVPYTVSNKNYCLHDLM